jgi:hypothetical protein
MFNKLIQKLKDFLDKKDTGLVCDYNDIPQSPLDIEFTEEEEAERKASAEEFKRNLNSHEYDAEERFARDHNRKSR